MRTGSRAVLGALGCVMVSAACSQEQMAREAEARAKAWGIPAVRITRDVVYAQYGQRRLMLDVYRPPESAVQGVNPRYFPETRREAVAFLHRYLRVRK